MRNAFLKTFLMGVILLSLIVSCQPTPEEKNDINTALSEQGCEIPPSFDGYTCKGRFVATNMDELISYLSDYGLKKGNVKHLKIDFDVVADAIQVTSPCSITVRDNASLTSTTGSSCLVAKGAVTAKGMNFSALNGNTTFASFEGNVIIDDNSTINTKNLNLIGQHKAVIQNTATINAHDISMKSFGTGEDARVHIRHSSNVTANNIFLEAKRKATLGRDSIYNVSGTIRIIGEGPDDDSENPEFATIWKGTTVNTNELIINSLSKTKVSGGITVNANRVELTGPACSIGKTAVINSPVKEGNCFSGDHPTAVLKVAKVLRSGTAPHEVIFDASKSSDNVGIISYEWKLGDIETIITTEPNLTYTFVTPGVYKVRLKVIDGSGLFDYRTRKITVNEAPAPEGAPIAYFKFMTDEGELTTYFFGDAGSSPIVSGSYEVVGTGVTQSLNDFYKREENLFDSLSPALYQVKLTVTDSEGLSSSFTHSVDLTTDEGAPYVRFSAVQSGPNQVFVNAVDSFDPYEFNVVQVDWGDGSEIETDENFFFNHTYQNSGDYTITVTLLGESGKSTRLSKVISINDSATEILNPVANFEVYEEIDGANHVRFLEQYSGSPNGEIISFLWNFGDGETATGTDVVHFYDPGVYIASLTVTDFAGKTDTQFQKVIIDQAGAAIVLGLECFEDVNPQSFICDIEALDALGQLTELSIDFGDGNIITVSVDDPAYSEVRLNHTYESLGDYVVVAKALTSRGDFALASTTNILEDNGENYAPIAAFNCSASLLELSCESTSTDPNQDELSLSWSTSRGHSGSNNVESFTSTQKGFISVTLDIDDGNGLSSSLTKNYELFNGNEGPKVLDPYFYIDISNEYEESNSFDIEIEMSSYEGEFPINSATFTIIETSETKVLEDFHFGNKLSFEGLTEGNYKIRLDVTDTNGTSASVTHNINYDKDVFQAPILNYEIVESSPSKVFINARKTFSYYSLGMKELEVDWGDGSTTIQESSFFLHDYTSPGSYEVTLTARTNSGIESSLTKTIEVTGEEVPLVNPIANFHKFENPGTQHVSFIEVNSGTPNGQIESYLWDFGDGSFGEGSEVIHFYEPGVYSVTLTVVDSLGLISKQKQRVISYSEGSDIVAIPYCDNLGEGNVLCDLAVADRFEELSKIIIDWGNGIEEEFIPSNIGSSSYLFTHQYLFGGHFGVSFKVITDRGEEIREVAEVEVNDLNILPFARVTCIGLDLVTTCYADQSFDQDGFITEYIWDIDGEIISSATVPFLEFTSLSYGLKNVSLKVVDNLLGESTINTQVDVIEFINLPPEISFNCESVKGLSIKCDANGTKDEDGFLIGYQWDLGDGGQNSDNLIISHNYSSTGEYNISLTVIDNLGATSTLVQVINVFDLPESIFEISDTVGTSPFSISTSNNSTSGANIVSYKWTVSNGDTYFTENIDFVTIAPGKHILELEITDNLGRTHKSNKSYRVEFPNTPPEDPELLAPELRYSDLKSPLQMLSFFFEGGAQAIQRVDDKNVFKPELAAAISGYIYDENMNPIEGAMVRVLNSPQYGFTISRLDGGFDLLVNQGTTRTIEIIKSGYAQSLVKEKIDAGSFGRLENVILTKKDDNPKIVNLASLTDDFLIENGNSNPLGLILKPNTTATVTLENGTETVLSETTFRLTEVSINEPQKLSIQDRDDIPEYAYEFDLSLDEADSLNEKRVTFSKDIPIYLANTENFEVGTALGQSTIENGSYKPEDLAFVYKVESIVGNKAELSLIDGEYLEMTANTKSLLSITEKELEIIASKFNVGDTFLRGKTNHFSGFSWCKIGSTGTNALNKCISTLSSVGNSESCTTSHSYEQCQEFRDKCIQDRLMFLSWESSGGKCSSKNSRILGTNKPRPRPIDTEAFEKFLEKLIPNQSCTEAGSEIDVLNRTVAEFIPVEGTDFSLIYNSNRTKSYPVSIEIPLIGNDVPAELVSVDVEVEVLGKKLKSNYLPSESLKHVFTWDNMDKFNRKTSGQTKAKIRLTYNFTDQVSPQIQTRRFDVLVGKPDLFANSVGGWNLSNHHFYDKASDKIHFGNGKVLSLGPEYGYTASYSANQYGDDNIYKNYDLNAFGEFRGIKGIAARSKGKVNFDGNYHQIHPYDSRGASLTFDLENLVFKRDNIRNGPHFFDEYHSDLEVRYDFRKISIYKRDNFGSFNLSQVIGGGIKDFESGVRSNDVFLESVKGVFIYKDKKALVFTNENELYEIGDDGILNKRSCSSNCETQTGHLWLKEKNIQDITVDYNPLFIDYQDRVYFNIGNTFDHMYRINRNGEIEGVIGSEIDAQVGLSNVDARKVKLGYDEATINIDRNNIIYLGNGEGTIYKIGDDFKLEQILITKVGLGELENTETFTKSQNKQYLALLRGNLKTKIQEYFINAKGNLGSTLKMFPKSNRFTTIEITKNRILRDYIFEVGSNYIEFNERGMHLSTTDKYTGKKYYQFEYDESDRLISIKNSFNEVSQIQRDFDGNAFQITGYNGQINQISLDEENNLSSITQVTGGVFSVFHDEQGQLLSFSDPNNNQTIFEYDLEGNFKKEINATGSVFEVTKTTEEGLDNFKATRDGVLSREYSLGRSSENLSFSTTKDLLGLSSGSSVEYLKGVLNSLGQTSLKEEIQSSRDDSVLTISKSNSFIKEEGEYQDRINYKTPNGRELTFFDSSRVFRGQIGEDLGTGFSNLFSTSLGSYEKIYLPEKGLISYVNPTKTVLTEKYDELGNLTKITKGRLEPVEYFYNNGGRVEIIKQGDRETSFGYDNYGFLNSVLSPDGSTVQFENDLAGRVTKQIHDNGDFILFEYDLAGNLTSIKPPSKPVHIFGYNGLNFLESYLPPILQVGVPTATSYTYNNLKQLTGIDRPDGKSISFAYNNLSNNIESMSHPKGSTSFVQDSIGRIIKATTFDGESEEYTYDGPLLTNIKLTGTVNANMSLDYDGNFNLIAHHLLGGTPPYNYNIYNTSHYDGVGHISSNSSFMYFNYDSANFLTSTALFNKNGIDTEYERNNFGEVISKEASLFIGAGTQGLRSYLFNYTRDNTGRILEIDSDYNGVGKRLSYEYGANGQLSKVYKDGILESAYTYDANGNRISFNDDIYTYDDQDRLTSVGNKTFSYNENGDLESIIDSGLPEHFEYDVFGNLRKYTKQAKIVTYAINARNQRIGKYLNGVLQSRFVYGKYITPVFEINADNTSAKVFNYDHNGRILGMRIGVTDYRIHTDHLGSPIIVYNIHDKRIEQEMEYDEFGNITKDTNPGFQPFGFAGGLYDSDTGLTRFGARDYNPSTGRFVSKDPIGFRGGDSNLYRYVNNNPVNFIDPSGLLLNDPNGLTLSKEFLSSSEARNLATTLDRSSVTYNIISGNAGSGRFGSTDTRSLSSSGVVNIYINTSRSSGSGVNSTSSTLFHELQHGYFADRGRVDSNFNDFNSSKFLVEPYIRNQESEQFGVQCGGR